MRYIEVPWCKHFTSYPDSPSSYRTQPQRNHGGAGFMSTHNSGNHWCTASYLADRTESDMYIVGEDPRHAGGAGKNLHGSMVRGCGVADGLAIVTGLLTYEDYHSPWNLQHSYDVTRLYELDCGIAKLRNCE